jgi:GR25 family glycosyltransferase involved in LPS biosynthesis
MSASPLPDQPVEASSYVGAFINLDRSPQRRAEMEGQFTALGIADRYMRFPAVDGSRLNYNGPLQPGEAGSFLSHLRAMEQLRPSGKCIHILEDDALLSRPMGPMIEFAIAQGILDYFDILYTDVYVAFEYLSSIRFHKQQYDDFLTKSQVDFQKSFKVLTLEGETFYGLSSYVVSAKAIDRVVAYFRQEAARGPTMANDIFVNRLVLERKLRAGYLFPFLTALRLERALQMTVSGRSTDRYTMVTLGSNLIRYSFYVENDLPGYAAPLLDRAIGQSAMRPRDAHQKFINRAMEYVAMIEEPKQGQRKGS